MKITVFEENIEVPNELWEEYMETGHFVNTADGVFELERILKTVPENLPQEVIKSVRDITKEYKPPTQEEIKRTVHRKKKEGLL